MQFAKSFLLINEVILSKSIEENSLLLNLEEEFSINYPNNSSLMIIKSLLEEINSEVASWNAEVSILLVNDASTEAKPQINLKLNRKVIK